MATDHGTVLFQRCVGDEEECDSDVWDDTALIAAYDAAVAPLKARIAERTGDPSILQSVINETRSTNGHKKKKKKKKKAKFSKKKLQENKPSSTGWAVGDLCQAVFTEDNKVYRAKIVSIDADSGTCVVRYLGYGNEEEQELEDLMPAGSPLLPPHHHSSSASCSETESEASQQSTDSPHNKRNGKAAGGPWSWPGFPPFQSAKMPPPPPPPPFWPKNMGAGPFPVPNMPMGSSTSMPFSMIPPPPPPMPGEHAGSENEALCSMLLAWYMSGYHTGYYQGLLHGRQHDPSGATGPCR